MTQPAAAGASAEHRPAGRTAAAFAAVITVGAREASHCCDCRHAAPSSTKTSTFEAFDDAGRCERQ